MIFKLSLDFLIIETIILSIVSFYITKRVNRRIVSASNAYWFGWLFLILGSKYAINQSWIYDLEVRELNFISELNFGAFFGFLFASLFSGNKLNYQDEIKFNKFYLFSTIVINRVSTKILTWLFFFGLIFLLQRIYTVGLDVNYFTNVRQIFLERNFNFIAWIGVHVSVVINVVIIMLGVKDAGDKMNLRILLKIILCSAPLFLANGTRTFLFAPLIVYLSSFFLMRGFSRNNKSLISLSEIKQISLLIFSLTFVFAIIGFVRGGYGTEFDFVYTVLIWPISTVNTLDSWITAALTYPSTNGLLTFGWFFNFLDRIGLFNISEEQSIISNILDDFILSNDSASVIPRSILPDLIFDFGVNGLFPSIFIICFVLQIITLKFVGKNLFLHSLAVMCLTGAFMTIQTSLISPGFVATIFWSFAIYFIFSRKIVIS